MSSPSLGDNDPREYTMYVVGSPADKLKGIRCGSCSSVVAELKGIRCDELTSGRRQNRGHGVFNCRSVDALGELHVRCRPIS
jgi:hypothetical protein